jgi:hypothetical protein
MTQSDLKWPRTAMEIVWKTQYDFRWVKSTSASPFWGPSDLDISIYSDSVTSQRETTILWSIWISKRINWIFSEFQVSGFFSVFLALNKVLAALRSRIRTCLVFVIHFHFRTMWQKSVWAKCNQSLTNILEIVVPFITQSEKYAKYLHLGCTYLFKK